VHLMGSEKNRRAIKAGKELTPVLQKSVKWHPELLKSRAGEESCSSVFDGGDRTRREKMTTAREEKRWLWRRRQMC